MFPDPKLLGDDVTACSLNLSMLRLPITAERGLPIAAPSVFSQLIHFPESV